MTIFHINENGNLRVHSVSSLNTLYSEKYKRKYKKKRETNLTFLRHQNLNSKKVNLKKEKYKKNN